MGQGNSRISFYIKPINQFFLNLLSIHLQAVHKMANSYFNGFRGERLTSAKSHYMNWTPLFLCKSIGLDFL